MALLTLYRLYLNPRKRLRNRIIKGVNILGPERIILDPDCGLRMQTPETAYAKLKRLSTAAKTVRDDL